MPDDPLSPPIVCCSCQVAPTTPLGPSPPISLSHRERLLVSEVCDRVGLLTVVIFLAALLAVLRRAGHIFTGSCAFGVGFRPSVRATNARKPTRKRRCYQFNIAGPPVEPSAPRRAEVKPDGH